MCAFIASRLSLATQVLRRTLLPAIAVAGTLTPAVADTVDWRYCLSVLRAQHRTYVTLPFPTTEPLQTLQDSFAAALTAAGIPFDSVQCPRGNEMSIIAMRQHALRYNRQSGNTIITVDWRP